MAKPSAHPTLTIKINAELAADYRRAYRRAFGSDGEIKQTLVEFITGAVEDRIVQEIEFLEKEADGNRR